MDASRIRKKKNWRFHKFPDKCGRGLIHSFISIMLFLFMLVYNFFSFSLVVKVATELLI